MPPFMARDLTTTVIADPEDLLEGETLMLEIAGELDNVTLPMLAARHIAMEDMQQRFDTETDPENTPWEPLDPDYWRYKQSLGFPDKILQRTQDLMHAATSADAWLIFENTMMFNPEVLPSYGLLHQAGSGDPSHHGMRADNVERAASAGNRIEGGSHSSLGIGRGNALPARPFIGMSSEAEDKIFFVFEEWFNEVGGAGSALYIRPTGVAQSRGAGGKFGSKVA